MQPAVGGAGGPIGFEKNNDKIFGFRKAPQTIRAVHLVEERMHVFRDDRAFRVV